MEAWECWIWHKQRNRANQLGGKKEGWVKKKKMANKLPSATTLFVWPDNRRCKPLLEWLLPHHLRPSRQFLSWSSLLRDSNLRQVVTKTCCHTGGCAAHQNSNVADTAFYWKTMSSRTFLAGEEKQCLVSKLQWQAFCWDHICGLVSLGVSHRGMVWQTRLLALH